MLSRGGELTRGPARPPLARPTTAVCKSVFSVEISLVSLVDLDRQWFLSKSGITVPQTGRDESFCSHAILTASKPFVITDTLLDERFRTNTLVVGFPHIRFYAGVSLVIQTPTEQLPMGTLCIIDNKPRKDFSGHEQQLLLQLGKMARDHLQSVLPSLTTSGGKAMDACAPRIQKSFNAGKGSLPAEILRFHSEMEGILIVEDDTGKGGEPQAETSLPVMVCNPGWVNLTGFSFDQTVGRSITSFVGSTMPEAIKASALVDAVRKGTRGHLEGWVKKQDGTVLWMTVTLEQFGRPAEGERRLLVVKMQDQTEQKELLTDMAKGKAIAEASTVAKSRFLANMSHELRTPMNAINACSLLLSEEALNTEQLELVQMIRCSAGQMLALLNQVLEFSKFESDKSIFKLRNENFSLHTFVEEALEAVSILADRKRLDYGHRVVGDAPSQWNGSLVHVRQVLINLCTNAVKFTDSGQIFINVTYTWTSPAKEQGMIKVEVKDTGKGISPEDLELVFLPFEQADTSLTRNISGTGLGLSISKMIVEKLGGRIYASSTVNEGSTFTFEVPLKVSSHKRALEPSYDIPHPCLVISPSPANRDTMLSILESMNVKVKLADVDAVPGLLKSGEQFFMVILDRPRTLTEEWLECGRVVAEWADREREKRRSKAVPVALVHSRGAMSVSQVYDLTYAIIEERKRGPSKTHSTSDDNIPMEADVASKPWLALFYEKPIMKISKPITLDKMTTLITTFLQVTPPEKHGDGNGTLSGPTNSKKSKSEPKAAHMNILVCEDNLLNQRVIQKVLKSIGPYKIKIASNGQEGLDAVKEEVFDLILMDIHMPVMDGLEASKRIMAGEHLGTQKPPIIALTADIVSNVQEESKACGMVGFLVKPINRNDLIDILGKYAQTPRAPRAAT